MSRNSNLEETFKILKCPICLDSMVPPIYQCKDGHTLCSQCFIKISSCPTCRCSQVDIRCRALEQLAETLGEEPCRFSSFGCKDKVRYLYKKDHEESCHFRSFGCLHNAEGCEFEGSIGELVEHLVSNHKYTQVMSQHIDMKCTNKNARFFCVGSKEEQYLWQHQIYNCHDSCFVLRVHRRVEPDASFFVSLSALHPKHHSNRYSVAADGNHRKYTFEGPVWTIRKGFKELERVRDCLILPENIVLFLSGGKGSESDLACLNLHISGQIYPPCESHS